MPGLFVAQQVAGAAQFEVLHGDVEAASERRVLRDGGEAVVRLLGHRLGRVVQEVGVRAFAAAADTPAQLVQLGEAEPVGVVYDQRVRVGDVESGLDDRRAYEHVDVAMPEVADYAVELLLPHLAVSDADSRLGDELVDLRGRLRDVLHAVVHVEHLSAAQQFAPDRGRDLSVLVRAHVGEHGKPVLGRVASVDISRMPVTAISSVRGIGVADSESTSTLVRSALSVSLCSRRTAAPRR